MYTSNSSPLSGSSASSVHHTRKDRSSGAESSDSGYKVRIVDTKVKSKHERKEKKERVLEASNSAKESLQQLDQTKETKLLLRQIKGNVKILNDDTFTGKGRLAEASLFESKREWDFREYTAGDRAVENAVEQIEKELTQLLAEAHHFTPHQVLKDHIRPNNEDRQWIQEWDEIERELAALKNKLHGTRVFIKLDKLKNLAKLQSSISPCFNRLHFMQSNIEAARQLEEIKKIRSYYLDAIANHHPSKHPEHLQKLKSDLERIVEDLEVIKRMSHDNFYPSLIIEGEYSGYHLLLESWMLQDKIKDDILKIDLALSSPETQKLFHKTIKLYCKESGIPENTVSYKIKTAIFSIFSTLWEGLRNLLAKCKEQPDLRKAFVKFLTNYHYKDEQIQNAEFRLFIEHPQLKLFKGVHGTDSISGVSAVRQMLIGLGSEGITKFTRQSRRTSKPMTVKVDNQAYRDFERPSRITVRGRYIVNVHPDESSDISSSTRTGEQTKIPKTTPDKLINELLERLNIRRSVFEIFTRICQQGVVADLGGQVSKQLTEVYGKPILLRDAVWQSWNYDKTKDGRLVLNVYMPHPLQTLSDSDIGEPLKDHQGKPMEAYVIIRREISVPINELLTSVENSKERTERIQKLVNMLVNRDTEWEKILPKLYAIFGEKNEYLSELKNKQQAFLNDPSNQNRRILREEKEKVIEKLKEMAVADFMPNISVVDSYSPVCATIEETLDFINKPTLKDF